jgi:hypothetical protein
VHRSRSVLRIEEREGRGHWIRIGPLGAMDKLVSAEAMRQFSHLHFRHAQLPASELPVSIQAAVGTAHFSSLLCQRPESKTS